MQNTSVEIYQKFEESKEQKGDLFDKAKEENQPIEDVLEGEEEEDDPKYACENEYGIGP